jgi:ATP-binding cassette subfamily B protein/ATP-binding cassette subfamily C protein/ATP-binding cassette subfamily B multidrug efflux pump
VARSRALRSDINAQAAEAIAGMAVIQASGADQRFAARFGATNQAYYDSRRSELRANAWLLRPALDLLNVAMLAAVIGVYGLRELDAVGGAAGAGLNALEVGVLYAFVSYIGRVVEPLIQITMQFSQLQQAVVAAARVNNLLAEPLAPQSSASGRIHAGRISVRGLDFGYQPGRPVLHGLNLEIPAGHFVGIVGHTGSGKSTLLSLLLRFYPAPAGALCIDSQPIAEIGDDDFRRAVGLVPQEPFLLAASARENITMGRTMDDAAVEAAARAANAHDFISRLAQGYDTPLGEGGARLAVGEKQLIAMARALAGAPTILLLDEATAHIDSETEARLQRSLTALHGRVTVLAIAHRLSTVRDADTIVVLNHGRIAERGSHAALMAISGGIYQRLVQLQQLEDDDG